MANKVLIEQANKFIDENFHRFDLELSEFCAAHSYSERTVQRELKADGLGWRERLNETRMDHACDYLANTKLEIWKVSKKCGYKSVSLFNRRFKESQGITAGEYIEKYR